MQVDRWFPTLIYRSFLNLDDSKIIEMIDKCYELKKENFENKTGWCCNVYTTSGTENLYSYKEFKPLFNECFSHVINFSKEFLVTPESILLDYSWVNISSPNNYQEFHNHSNSHFSAVYYLKVPKNSGKIIFKSHEAIYNMFPVPNNQLNENTIESCSYEPKQNLLLIFRSNLLHMVTMNESHDDRISIAMNFRCERNK